MDKLFLAGDQVEDGMKSATKDINKYVDMLKKYFNGEVLGEWLIKIIFALLLYIVGRKIVKTVVKVTKKNLKKSSIEDSVSRFLSNVIAVALNTIVILLVLTVLGVPASSFIAIVGSAGLAIGLALQGSIGNFAGGVLILILKPFKVNDYIVSNGIEGKVTEIDIFYTKLITPDNQKVVVPNGTLTNSAIRNVPDEDYRRLDLIVPVAYNSDIKLVRSVLTLLANNEERILKEKGVDVFVESFGDSAINIIFRAWVETANFFPVKFDIQEKIIEKFREENIEIPFNQLDVNINQ